MEQVDGWSEARAAGSGLDRAFYPVTWSQDGFMVSLRDTYPEFIMKRFGPARWVVGEADEFVAWSTRFHGKQWSWTLRNHDRNVSWTVGSVEFNEIGFRNWEWA